MNNKRENNAIKALTSKSRNVRLVGVRKEEVDMYEVLKKSGKGDMIARLLSMTYLTYSIANAYAEEAITEVEKLGIMRKKLKTRTVNLGVAFDLFDKEYWAMAGRPEMKQAFCEDYELLKEKLDIFMNTKEQ